MADKDPLGCYFVFSRDMEYQLPRSALYEKLRDNSYTSKTIQDFLIQEDNLDHLSQLWTSREYSDVKLIVEETVIPAHKCVLVACSDFFRAMFSGDFAEGVDGRDEVKLSDISSIGIRIVLHAIYTGQLTATDKDVLTVIDTADKLQVSDIIEICEDFLVQEITPENCFQLLKLSEKYTLIRLNTQIERFVLVNFVKVTENSLYPDIPKDVLVTFISNDEMDSDEIDIFQGVMTWFEKNDDSSKKEKANSLYDVLKHIRFTYMSSAQINEVVLKNKTIATNTACLDTVRNALEYVSTYELQTYSRPIMEASNPEKPRGKLAVTVIHPEAEDSDEQLLRQPSLPQLFFFGFTPDGTVDMSDMSCCASEVDFTIFGMNIVQMGNTLFFLGVRQTNPSKDEAKMMLLRFNVQSGEWLTLQDPPFDPLIVSVSVVHNEDIYLFGGATYLNQKLIPQYTFQRGCYKYSIPNNVWTGISVYPHPVAHPAACVLGDDIYVIGGGGPTYDTYERDKVYVYDTLTGEWTSKCPDLRQGRSGHRVCSLNGKIYTIGGRNPNKTDIPKCEMYDPAENQWVILTSAPVPRPVASFNLLTHNDKIIILGGGDDKDNHHTTVQTLDTTSLTWSTYNWKEDQPNFVPMGSIHNLPLVRVRLSCCTKSEYVPQQPNTSAAKNAENPKQEDEEDSDSEDTEQDTDSE